MLSCAILTVLPIVPKPLPAADATPQFVATGKWEHAGYNSDEIIYTVFIENRDSRILRCNVRMQGSFISNGKKSAITDRQVTTVFPQQQVPAGIWMDMDEASGASYDVKCKPV